MTNPSAESSRDDARRPNGQFGTQPRSEAPPIDLGDVLAPGASGAAGTSQASTAGTSGLSEHALPAVYEPRLRGLTENQHIEREHAYLSAVAEELRQGERPINAVLDFQDHSHTPTLLFPDFDSGDHFFVSAESEDPDESKPSFREINIVPGTAEEFPRLPYGFDDGDAEKSAEVIRAFIIARGQGRRPSGLWIES